MPSPTPDTYQVALKVFFRNGDKVLICKEDNETGNWDLPGGRIAVGEFDTPLEAILRREILEELGDKVSYKINGPVALFRLIAGRKLKPMARRREGFLWWGLRQYT